MSFYSASAVAQTPRRLSPPSSSSSGRQRRQRRGADHPSTTEIVPAPINGQEVLNTEELLRQILVKIPSKLLFRCTLVSKSWSSIITDPQLLRNLKPSRNPVAIYLRRHTLKANCYKFSRIPLIGNGDDCHPAKVNPTTVTLDFVKDQDPRGIKIDSSCNGLFICTTSISVVNNSLGKLAYVYNPTIKHYFQIPEPKNSVISMNLAFVAPDKFKIVAVCSSSLSSGVYHIELLEPGVSRRWREPEGLRFPDNGLDTVLYEYGVFINGAIYWPSNRSSALMYFKLEEERIVWLPDVPQPSCDGGWDILFFGECKGRLNVVRKGSVRRRGFDMLELMSDHSAWCIKYHIDLSSSCDDLLVEWDLYPFYILALVPGEEEEGKSSCLIVHIPGRVVSYNLKDHSLKMLCDLNLRHGDMQCLTLQPWYYVHSCIETVLRP